MAVVRETRVRPGRLPAARRAGVVRRAGTARAGRAARLRGAAGRGSTARGSAWRPTTAPSRTSWAGSAPRCTCRRAATGARRRSPGCRTWASRRAAWSSCTWTAARCTCPAHGAPVRLADEGPEGRKVGFVTTSVRHHELGPIALALVKRNVPLDAGLLADGTAAARRSSSTRRDAPGRAEPQDPPAGPARSEASLRPPQHRERAVVGQRHPHPRAEPARLHRRAQRPEPCHDLVDQRLGDVAGRGRVPGGAAALAGVSVEGELADRRAAGRRCRCTTSRPAGSAPTTVCGRAGPPSPWCPRGSPRPGRTGPGR